MGRRLKIEGEALVAIGHALEGLPREAQGRILRAAALLCGVDRT